MLEPLTLSEPAISAMTASPTNPLFAASQVQGMATQMPNQKLAFTLTGLSVALVGMMVFREMSHCLREQFREHDRRSMWPGDRRGPAREGGHPDPSPRRMR